MTDNKTPDQDDIDNNTPRENDGERIEETTSIKRNKLDKKIIYKSTGKDYSDLILNFPSSTYQELIKQIENAPKVDPNGSKDLREWRACVQRSIYTYPLGNIWHDSLNTSGKKFSNSFITPENVELVTAPIKNTKAGKNVQGEQAEIYFRRTLGLGAPMQIPLIHSGIYLVLTSPSSTELSTAYFSYGQTKISLGRNAKGLLYDASTSLLEEEILNILKRHIYKSNLVSEVEENIFDYIDIRDKNILIAALAAAWHPEGYRIQVALPLTDDNNAEIKVDDFISIQESIVQDFTMLTDAQIAHLSTKVNKKYTAEDLAKYRENSKIAYSGSFNITNNTKIELSFCSISKFLKNSNEWISQTIRLVDSALSIDNDNGDRDELISKTAKINHARTYGHMVKSIVEIDEDGIDSVDVIDEESIAKVLSIFSDDNDLQTTFIEKVIEFNVNNSHSVTALPAITDLEATESERTNFPGYIAYDPISFFFNLMVGVDALASSNG